MFSVMMHCLFSSIRQHITEIFSTNVNHCMIIYPKFCVTRSLMLCNVCRSLFVLLAIVLSVLRFTDSDYPIAIIQTLTGFYRSKSFKYCSVGVKQQSLTEFSFIRVDFCIDSLQEYRCQASNIFTKWFILASAH